MTDERAIDPLLKAALDRLPEPDGPKWSEDERDAWTTMFCATIEMLHPARKRRRRGAPDDEAEPE